MPRAAAENFMKLRSLFRDLRQRPQDEVAPLIKFLLKRTGYRALLKVRGREDDLVKLDQLYELVSAAKDFDDQQGGGLEGFLQWVALMQEGSSSDDENKIMLMTCHAAKGLEFKRVYLVGVVDGLMPFIRHTDMEQAIKSPEQQSKDLEEERRIFFVAVTRAQDRLTLSHFRERLYQNNTIECHPSRFLNEAGETVKHLCLADEIGKTSYYGSPTFRAGPKKEKQHRVNYD
jgi:DNA helicase-2/ATP-dependent DNA helicase PcrA